MKNCLLFLLTLFLSSHLVAQQNIVTGRVTDAGDGSPMIGAAVQVKGTSNGTITDMDGKFSLSVPAGRPVLVFSSIGYKEQEITLQTGQKTVNVAMREDVEMLSEVVVVGYGTMKKSDLSGASVSVGEKALKSSIATNLDQALQGKAAGVTSVMTSGAPGSSMSINIRGQATINASSQPLYVIDGVIWQGGSTTGNSLGLNLGNGAGAISPLSNLNPSDIVSMEILKDASATAIYGAQGANGVVLITTKRGKAGEARFTYEGMVAVQEQYKRLDMMNLREYAEYSSAIAATTGGSTATAEYQDPSLLGAGTNWQDAVFRPALMHQHTISAEGGSDKVKYYFSGSYMNQDGTIIGTDFDRFSGRLNLDAQLKSWFKLGVNVMYSQTKEHLNVADGTQGILTYSLQTPPDIPIYDAEGNFASQVREGYTRVNPIAIASLDTNTLKRQKLNGSIFWDITFVKGLTWHAELGYDFGWSDSKAWQPTYDFGGGVKREKNAMAWQKNNNTYWNLKNYLTYNGQIGKHSFTAMVGQEASESNWDYLRVRGLDLGSNVVQNPGIAAEDNQTFVDGYGDGTMASFFTRETYNYNDRYLLTYTFRYDGSSAFGPDNRWAAFHSLAGSWRFSNEKFWEPIRNIINNGKLRVGWGQTGNANIGQGLWGATISAFPTGLGQAYKQSQIANPAVHWETQNQWNIGLDLSFLNDRINLTIDWYNKRASDLLMRLQLPTYFGSRGNANSALTAPMGNYGTIENKGLEISLNTHNLTGNFTWDTDFQISFNRNKLVALSGTDASAIEGYGQWSDVVSLSQVGKPLFQFYGYIADGVYKDKADIMNHLKGESFPNGFNRYSTVFPGDIKYRDLNGDGKIDTGDRTIIGNPLPDFTFGFNNTFSYKGFDLTIFLQGSVGNDVFNALGRELTGMGYWTNQLRTAMDYAKLVPIDANKVYPITNDYGVTINNWFEDVDNVVVSNPNTQMSRAGQGLPYNNTRISTKYIEDGSYLRVKNIMLGYTLPKPWLKKAGIENIRVYCNVQNLLTLTGYSGFDPEVGANAQDATGYTFGFDMGRYPSPRTVSFGANISF
ncbi:MAG: TonB-dependent receptor [Prevotellaceae bacterium]|jgi:TonB-linked SusC/RagA family outer membrane protein|nr:TonB-dependent receptor [Prevotellaceae bacterium]